MMTKAETMKYLSLERLPSLLPQITIALESLASAAVQASKFSVHYWHSRVYRFHPQTLCEMPALWNIPQNCRASREKTLSLSPPAWRVYSNTSGGNHILSSQCDLLESCAKSYFEWRVLGRYPSADVSSESSLLDYSGTGFRQMLITESGSDT